MKAALSADNVFELGVEDDGKGFAESEPRKNSGRGLANIRARASMIDANADWQNGPRGGTIFKLLLPTGPVTQPNS
jgi:signal transduction histidine kinase